MQEAKDRVKAKIITPTGMHHDVETYVETYEFHTAHPFPVRKLFQESWNKF